MRCCRTCGCEVGARVTYCERCGYLRALDKRRQYMSGRNRKPEVSEYQRARREAKRLRLLEGHCCRYCGQKLDNLRRKVCDGCLGVSGLMKKRVVCVEESDRGLKTEKCLMCGQGVDVGVRLCFKCRRERRGMDAGQEEEVVYDHCVHCGCDSGGRMFCVSCRALGRLILERCGLRALLLGQVG